MANVAHPPISGKGDWTARMETCPDCRGSGVNMQKPLAPPTPKVDFAFEDAEDAYAVIALALPNLKKPWGKQPGWTEVYGVLKKDASPADPKSYAGLFPTRAGAERFRAALGS